MSLPHALRTYHLVATIGWICMIPVSIITGLWHSVAFITLISLWALVSTEWGAWQASRAEVATVQADSATVNTEHADVNVKA